MQESNEDYHSGHPRGSVDIPERGLIYLPVMAFRSASRPSFPFLFPLSLSPWMPAFLIYVNGASVLFLICVCLLVHCIASLCILLTLPRSCFLICDVTLSFLHSCSVCIFSPCILSKSFSVACCFSSERLSYHVLSVFRFELVCFIFS